MDQTGLAESLIENEIGCGWFQVGIVLLVYCMIRTCVMFVEMFMTFGIYSPGWRCLDNVTVTTIIDNVTTTMTTPTTMMTTTLDSNNTFVAPVANDYRTDLSCAAYEACRQVEFNPDSTTVVTEWNLLCNKAWIPSLVISLRLGGTLVGSLFAGQVADSLGRKKALYVSVLATSMIALASAWSPSWQVLAGFQTVTGMAHGFYGSLRYTYPAEFMVKKWRGPLAGIPAWGISGICFALITMWLKNWRHLLIATSITCFLTFLPVIWVPESLRWLEVKNKKEEFRRVANKMARANGKSLTHLDSMGNSAEQTLDLQRVDSKRRTYMDLFRPGYKLITLLVALSYSSNAMIFFAINIGIKALSGDFYTNLIMVFCINIACGFFPFFAPNLLGRRGGSIAFEMLASVCLLVATCFELWTAGDVRLYGTLLPVLVAFMAVDTVICIMQVHIGELYPTVVRSLAVSWMSVCSRVSGMVVPFLIPNDTTSVYLWYLCMGVLGLFSSACMVLLPETKGKPLKETFSEKTTDNGVASVVVDGGGGDALKDPEDAKLTET